MLRRQLRRRGGGGRVQGRISSERLYRCMLLLYVRNLIDYSMLFLDGVTVWFAPSICLIYEVRYLLYSLNCLWSADNCEAPIYAATQAPGHSPSIVPRSALSSKVFSRLGSYLTVFLYKYTSERI